MRDFIADRLLMLSTWAYLISVKLKDAGIWVLIAGRRKRVDRLRGNHGDPIIHKHTQISGND
ncbi:hypothetical protein G6L30_17175 [Agrobacterium rhizogenes]|nr:hypothetical protein [Rhizobium rhizogenes]